MRSTRDRIRHALSFELIGLALVIPLGAWIFDLPFSSIGVVSIATATVATGWNYLYNLGFDHLLRWWRGDTAKTVPLRVVHALVFEIGLLAALTPIIAVYLSISLLAALVMDGAFSLFYLVYAFAFNWLYDVVFPVQTRQVEPGGA
ncbi:MAG: PACE efflux transporter [Allorhizobium sp.]